VRIWTPDKDLGQSVRESRVVQIDRRAQRVLDAAGVRDRFGVDPVLIPDFLALVGDSADGFPGIAGIGKVTAARLLNRYGPIEQLPGDVLADDRRELALLFKDLATLRTNADLFATVDQLRFRGPTPAFAAMAERLGDDRLAERSVAAASAGGGRDG
jgi:5'-3' exonuclease